jgi:solute carrier family 12 (potassium/chloride transporters), member 9
MVFVEFENEVAEETARVKVLLEKLRIEATIVVFWLASGKLNTYELIINGQCSDIDWEIVVNEALRDEEWWDDLQMFRGRYDHMSASQERNHLAHILDSTSGRPGVYNPHDESPMDRRLSEMSELAELHRSTKASLSRLGVNVGMHTHHLNEDILNESSSDDDASELGGESVLDGPGSLLEEDPDEEARQEFMDAVSRPLLTQRRTASQLDGPSEESTPRPPRGQRARFSTESPAPTYGTMSTSQTLLNLEQRQRTVLGLEARGHGVPKLAESGSSLRLDTKLDPRREDEDRTPFPSLTPAGEEFPEMQVNRARSASPSKRFLPHDLETPPPGRPSMSRQPSAVRFTSRLVPEATVRAEGDMSTIGFAHDAPILSRPTSPRLERPMASRQSSYGHGRFSSRPVPEARLTDGGDGQRTITFADQPKQHHSHHSPIHSRQHSRQHSQQHSRQQSRQNSIISQELPDLKPGPTVDDEAGSTFSTQSIALSFNDLPSRAQHLILNELMRQHSGDTAVLLSTLPVPSEGTSLDEGATIQYLSDIEVLCNELPPTLLVLSNNMTVTVSL